MSKKLVTVFTPTYNRAHTLVRTYESLCKQTCDDFEWLIIDDGSTDNTEEVVKGWLQEKKIPLRYIKKENGGLLSGYNKAMEYIDSELNVCVDSDDFMPSNAISIIKKEWDKLKDKNLAGIIGLDYQITGEVVGGVFPITGRFYYWEKLYKLKHSCDSKIVCRTDLMKKIAPLPTFGEKDFNPIWYYFFIGEKYKFHLINKCLCVVDYQPDGMSYGIYKQYRQSPKSNMETRRILMSSKFVPQKEKMKAALHYISSSIFSKNKNFIKESPQKLLTLLAIPPGLLLHCFILYKLYKQRKIHFQI